MVLVAEPERPVLEVNGVCSGTHIVYQYSTDSQASTAETGGRLDSFPWSLLVSLIIGGHFSAAKIAGDYTVRGGGCVMNEDAKREKREYELRWYQTRLGFWQTICVTLITGGLAVAIPGLVEVYKNFQETRLKQLELS